MMRQLSTMTLLALMACSTQERAFEGGLAGECSDGQDNDGDGKTDCEDSDCELHLDCNGGQAGTQTETTTISTGGAVIHGWDCESEDVQGMNKSGALMLSGEAMSLVGLCAGEFMVALDSEVHWLDTSGALYGFYPLSDDVMRLTLDAADDTLWASHNESEKVSQIDLSASSYTMTEHVLPGIVRRTAIGMLGNLFVATEETTTDASGTHVSLINGADGGNVTSWELGSFGQRMAFDELNSQLLVGDSSVTAFDYKVGQLQEKPSQSVSAVCSGARGELAISADDAHMVYPCVNGNGDGVNLVDFDPADLSSTGQYVLSNKGSPRWAAFSPDSAYLMAADNGTITVFDAQTREILSTHNPDTDQCLSASLKDISWSPLGVGIFTLWSCSSKDTPAQVSWWFPTLDLTTTTTETGSTTDTGTTESGTTTTSTGR